MAEELRDCRFKLAPQADDDMAALAAAKGCEKAELLREAVDLYLADENRKAHEYRVFLRMRTVQGVVGESSGSLQGKPYPSQGGT